MHHSTARMKRNHQSGYAGDDSGIDSEYESVGSKSKPSYSSIPGNPNVRAVLTRSENDEPPRKKMLQSVDGVSCEGSIGAASDKRSLYQQRLQQTVTSRISKMTARNSSGNQLNMRVGITNKLQSAATEVKNNLQHQEKQRLDAVDRVLNASLPVNLSIQTVKDVAKSLKKTVSTCLAKLNYDW